MKILIVSDTHGREYTLEKALKKTGPIDQLIHLGDVEGGEERIRMLAGNAPAAIIAGNNDFFCDLPDERMFTLEGYRIWMTHGHRILSILVFCIWSGKREKKVQILSCMVIRISR